MGILQGKLIKWRARLELSCGNGMRDDGMFKDGGGGARDIYKGQGFSCR